jgi:NAD(P)-dependent dehydrogenase (short-subunit alcohol dehydrogenase family)
VAFHEISDEDWFRVMAVNVAAPFFLVREAYRNMPTDGSASIVNVLSITARTGTGGPEGGTFSPRFPSMLVYGASKAALHNMTASLAHELAALRIRVNGVAPGFVATPMLSGTDGADALAAQVPLGRYADPSEVADAVEFLASAKASYITGACLDVNGGLHTS